MRETSRIAFRCTLFTDDVLAKRRENRPLFLRVLCMSTAGESQEIGWNSCVMRGDDIGWDPRVMGHDDVAALRRCVVQLKIRRKECRVGLSGNSRRLHRCFNTFASRGSLSGVRSTFGWQRRRCFCSNNAPPNILREAKNTSDRMYCNYDKERH